MGGLYGPGHDVRVGPLFFAWVALLVAAVICTDFSVKNGPSHVALALILLGGALNLIAIRLNGGRMPVRVNVIPPDYQQTHRPMDDRTRARVLGDWIAFRGNLLSPGDMSLFAGRAVLLAWALCCLASKYAGISL
jgi:Family of unknown function (DUF5317)